MKQRKKNNGEKKTNEEQKQRRRKPEEVDGDEDKNEDDVEKGIININTSAIRGLWYVTLTNLMDLTLLTGDAILRRPKILNTVSLASVSHHRQSRLSPAFNCGRLSRGTGQQSRLSADIGIES